MAHVGCYRDLIVTILLWVIPKDVTGIDTNTVQ